MARTAAGNEYTEATYVDPFPGRKGSERIQESCGRCGGTGVYQGPSGHKFHTPAVGAVTTGCFACEGRGHHTVLVSSRRATARLAVQRQNEDAAATADWEAGAPARAAAEAAAKAAAEAAEAARQAAKSKVLVGTVGERLRNMNVRVAMVRTYESANYVTGAPETKAVIKFVRVDGAVFSWFTGWTTLEEGDMVSLTGTVKKHDEYQGEAQTVLTRCIVK